MNRPGNLQLADNYLTALLNGDKQSAIALIHNAVKEGISVRDIYLQVFQPTLYQVGQLWQLNKVSVAQEHYCTAVTQLIMSQLYSEIVNDKKHYKFVGVCASGELHDVGLRMVCDFLEMEGWDSYYIGANVPAKGVIDVVCKQGADVVGISATLSYHIPIVTELISQLRAHSDLQRLKIMVGGYPFNTDPELWKQVGADAFSRDADEAVRGAMQLVQGEIK